MNRFHFYILKRISEAAHKVPLKSQAIKKSLEQQENHKIYLDFGRGKMLQIILISFLSTCSLSLFAFTLLHKTHPQFLEVGLE